MLDRLPLAQQHDPDVLTSMGNILLMTKQPEEACKRFAEALSLHPDYAPYEVNLSTALLESNPSRKESSTLSGRFSPIHCYTKQYQCSLLLIKVKGISKRQPHSFCAIGTPRVLLHLRHPVEARSNPEGLGS